MRAGTFELGPTRTFVDAEGERWEMREAVDALIMRALAQTLTPVLAPSRPRLHEAVKRLHGLFDGLHLRMYPEKTFVGRREKGFEFLGLRIDPACEADASPLCQPDARAHAALSDPLVREPPTLGEVLKAPPSGQVEVVVGSRAALVEGDAASPQRPTRPIRLRPARASWARFVARMRRLYEQGAASERLDAYLRHWLGWFAAGLRDGSLAPKLVAS